MLPRGRLSDGLLPDGGFPQKVRRVHLLRGYLHIPNVVFIWLSRFDPTLRQIHRDAVMRD